MLGPRLPLVSALLLGLALACGGAGPSEEALYVPGSVDEAHDLCAQKDPAGCLYLAQIFETDPSAKNTYEREFETYSEVSCGDGLASACYEIGFIRLTGQGGRPDKRKAARHLGRGCDLGDGRACFTGGVQIRRGDGVPKNGQQALALFEKACELQKDFKSCAEVGQMWTTNEIAGAPDMDTSKVWYEKACQAEPTHPFCKR